MADDLKIVSLDGKNYQVPQGLDDAGTIKYLQSQKASGGGRGTSSNAESNVGLSRGGVGGGQSGNQNPPSPQDFTNSSGRFIRNAIHTANPLPYIKLAGEGAKAGFTQNPADIAKFGTDIWRGVLEPSLSMVEKSNQEFSKGDIVGGLGYDAAALLPGVGPTYMHGAEQIGSGDTAGGLGTWTGLFSGLAAGEGLGRLAPLLREAAPSIYGKGLDIKVGKGGIGRGELQQVRERGLGRETKGATPPGAPVTASDSGIEGLETRIGDTKNEQMSKLADAQSSGFQLATSSVTKPLEDMIGRWKKSAMADAAKPLEEVLKTFKANHSKPTMDVMDVQELKENTDEILRSNVWGKDMEPGARDAAGKELRTAMRQSLEAVPDVKELNWAMHLDQALRKGIEQALEKHSFKEELLKPGAVGGFTLYELAKLNPGVAGAVGAAHIAKAALKSPALMSRLGIALDHAGISLPPALKSGGRASPFVLGVGKGETPPGADDKIKVKSAEDLMREWQSGASNAANGKQ